MLMKDGEKSHVKTPPAQVRLGSHIAKIHREILKTNFRLDFTGGTTTVPLVLPW